MQTMLERAHELDPDEIFIEAWLSTLLINGAIVLGQDLEPHIDHLWDMYERDPAIRSDRGGGSDRELRYSQRVGSLTR